MAHGIAELHFRICLRPAESLQKPKSEETEPRCCSKDESAYCASVQLWQEEEEEEEERSLIKDLKRYAQLAGMKPTLSRARASSVERLLGQFPSPLHNKRSLKVVESRGPVQATAGQVQQGTGDPCRLHATASRACL